MNYFEFYDIPVSFQPDENLIRQKFYTFSKAYHPDFFVNESEDKQQEILDLSTLNNKAYQVLANRNKRLPYILDIYGELEEGEKYVLPSDFLMEMMEVNEALMELEFEEDAAQLQKIIQEVDEIESNLDKELQTFINAFDEASETEKQVQLKKIKDIYYRKKYLLRIRESINRFATRL